MAITLAQLEGRLGQIANGLERGAARLLGEMAKEVGERLVIATPVDTGFARANWRPSINAPAEVPVSQLDATGAATIAKITTVGRRARAGDTIFITNNAPYIGALNAGSSPQAEAKFVEKAIKDGRAAALAGAQLRGLIRGGG